MNPAGMWSLVNPARAGMIPLPEIDELAGARKPRASGDDPEYVPGGWSWGDVNPARAGMILPVVTLSAVA